jgi:hypothetical protein
MPYRPDAAKRFLATNSELSQMICRSFGEIMAEQTPSETSPFSTRKFKDAQRQVTAEMLSTVRPPLF